MGSARSSISTKWPLPATSQSGLINLAKWPHQTTFGIAPLLGAAPLPRHSPHPAPPQPPPAAKVDTFTYAKVEIHFRESGHIHLTDVWMESASLLAAPPSCIKIEPETIRLIGRCLDCLTCAVLPVPSYMCRLTCTVLHVPSYM